MNALAWIEWIYLVGMAAYGQCVLIGKLMDAGDRRWGRSQASVSPGHPQERKPA